MVLGADAGSCWLDFVANGRKMALRPLLRRAYRETMARSLPRDRLATIEKYFAFEDASPTRHEYLHGQVHAMSGATRQHSRLMMEIAGRLWMVARGGRAEKTSSFASTTTDGAAARVDAHAR